MKTVVQQGEAGTGTVRRNISCVKQVENDFIAGKQGAGDIAWI